MTAQPLAHRAVLMHIPLHVLLREITPMHAALEGSP